MSFSYLGNPANVNIGNAYLYPALPLDGEQANSGTVTSPFIATANQLAYLGFQFSNLRPHVSMAVTGNFTTIAISPITVSVYDGTKWFFISKAASTISTANLEVPGNFAANIAYYIYLKITGDYIISLDVPDPTLCFKNSAATNSTQFRYIGSFTASGLTTIHPFVMHDYDYTMTIPMGTTYSNNNFQPVFDAPTTFAPFFRPDTVKTVKLIARLRSTAAIVDANGAAWYFDISADGAASSTNTFWPGFAVPGDGPYHVVTKEVPVNPNTKLLQATNFNKAGANNTTDSLIRIWWNGYKE